MSGAWTSHASIERLGPAAPASTHPLSAPDDVVAGVHLLIAEWLVSFSPAGEALSCASLRLVVGHLLLIQSGARAAADIASSPDSGLACRLAAAVFVLLTQEHLQYRRDSILGFEVDFVSNVLMQIIMEASLSRGALAAEVRCCDREGAATLLTRHRYFSDLFEQRHLKSSSSCRRRRMGCVMLPPICERAECSYTKATTGTAEDIFVTTSRKLVRLVLARAWYVAAAAVALLSAVVVWHAATRPVGALALVQLSHPA